MVKHSFILDAIFSKIHLIKGLECMTFLTLKAVPVVPWSSSQPLNLRPKVSTLFYLCVGLSIFGLGEATLVAANVGVSPWTVLAEGVSSLVGVSLGLATLLVSACVLLIWIPLKQTPGIGTLANALIVSLVIELSLIFLPHPESYWLQVLQAAAGVLLVGVGSGFYLVANLGPGPRDGLMTGLARLTDFPIAWVRTTLEISVVSLGWSLGGTIGCGTLLFAFGIGPAVSLGLFIVGSSFAKADAS